MNYAFASNKECSGGCESGWTSYLENSFISSQCASAKYKVDKFVEDMHRIEESGEEEEDLSMVSDASSGPPLFHQDEYNINRNYNVATIEEAAFLRKNSRTEKGRKNKRPKIKKQSSLLDDTASSSVFDFSDDNVDSMKNEAAFRPNVLDFSQGYSTTQFKGTSTYQEHYGFFHPCLVVVMMA
ncbi:hypothetical protein Leryth_016014, partial [Lithospermum erythrorhizon]